MSQRLTLALDAMGGDQAPNMVIDGAEMARIRFPSLDFLVFGNEGLIKPLLDRHRALADRTTLVHTDEVVKNEDKPSVALRAGRNSSMRLAIDAVKEGKAAGVVSAGNTGALMAMAKLTLRMLPGIDRPAIVSFYPTERGESCMLDLGANVECDAENLVQFAIMGDMFARAVLGIPKPTIGLLNVGSEEMKGHDEVKRAGVILREGKVPVEFYGFIEGDDITAGTVDVVVTDGFTGNVALKTAEGTARLYTNFIRASFKSSILARLGYLLSRGALRKVRERTDPRRYNGAVFLGLNGIAVKSHGGTDAMGFANAIGVANDMAVHGFLDKVRAELAELAAVNLKGAPA
ncbi:MAG: phosphate acyltransferase PlsX [Alphaproteobacteria bacterium]|nr:phosphate acyltransferase PlsX [Alphaproteobacteria bacterium]